jgi:signal peptidase I
MGVLASALLLAFCLINFVFQSYQVEGPSMRTTLQNSDHLIVWKVGKTLANVTGRQYVPHRGDVIIFNEPANAEAGGRPGKQLIKRVIGLPGDRVVYDNTDVIIYNKQYPHGFHPDKEMPYGDKIIDEKPSNVDVTLDTDEIFVSGDNRDNSLDSRIFGPLKLNMVVGKLVVRILPLNTFKLF